MYTYRFASSTCVHLTICMLDLNEPAKLEAAKLISEQLREDLVNCGVLTEEGLSINFDGVDTFPDYGPGVVNPKMFFLKIKEDAQFEKLKKVSDTAIRRCVEKNLINLGDKGNYRFHLSLVSNDFDQVKGTCISPIDKKLFDAHGGPESQLATLQQLEDSHSANSSESSLCVHNWPHLTFISGVRAPRKYEEFARRNAKEFGGRDSLDAKFKQIITAREGLVNWRTLMAEFNAFMAEDQNSEFNITETKLPFIDLSNRFEKGEDNSYLAEARISL